MKEKSLRRIYSTTKEVFVSKVKGLKLYLHIEVVDGEVTSEWFSKSPSKKYNYSTSYNYVSDKGLEIIKTKSVASFTDKDYKDLWQYSHDLEEIDPSRIYRLDRGSNLIFLYGKEAPITPIYKFNYIGGINDEYFHLDEVFTYLSKHPNVKECSIEDIPYYNREPYLTRGLRLSVQLDQKDIDNIWEYYKDRDFPSVRLKESIISIHDKRFDPLGIKIYKKTLQEVEESRRDNDDD